MPAPIEAGTLWRKALPKLGAKLSQPVDEYVVRESRIAICLQ
jgi:hypothetical protein